MSWSKPYHSIIRNVLAQERERLHGPSSNSALEVEAARHISNGNTALFADD